MADWLSSFRYALRALRRQPTFVLIALLTLALGIGANTALFSIIQAVVLNPLPYDAPEKIVVLWEVNPDGVLDRVSVPTFEDLKGDVKSLESVAAYRRADFSFAQPGDPLSVSGVRATPELFAVLRANARLGRRSSTNPTTSTRGPPRARSAGGGRRPRIRTRADGWVSARRGQIASRKKSSPSTFGQ